MWVFDEAKEKKMKQWQEEIKMVSSSVSSKSHEITTLLQGSSYDNVHPTHLLPFVALAALLARLPDLALPGTKRHNQFTW